MNATFTQLREDLVKCIDDFVERCEQYNKRIASQVRAKPTRTGFVCIVAIKKLCRDGEITIAKSAMKIRHDSDLDLFKSFLNIMLKFVRHCYRNREM